MNEDATPPVYRRARRGEKPDALFYPGRNGTPYGGILEGREGDAPEVPGEFHGTADVAGWCEVGITAVAKWRERYTDVPVEDARLILTGDGLYERYYRPGRKTELRNYARSHSRGAPGTPKPQTPEAQERRLAAAAGSRGPDRRGRIHISKVAALLKWRATVPYGPERTVLPALNAAPGRIVVSATDDPDSETMWLWAADEASAEAATRAMPGLEFVEIKHA